MTDDSGNALLPIEPTNILYRRGRPKKFLNPDGSVSSRVFALREKDNGQLSIDIASLCKPIDAITARGEFSPDQFWLASISVADVHSLNLEAFCQPLTVAQHNVENPAHGFIWGMQLDDDILPGLLARKSRRVL